MKITKPPSLGTTAFEVEWCSHLPVIEGTNDADMDNAKFNREYYTEEAEAMARAKELLPQAVWGAAFVTECEWVDPIGEGFSSTFEWEPQGNTVEVSS